MHSVQVLPSAARDFDALDRQVFERIKTRIRDLADSPRPVGAIKLTAEEGYRIRVGDYRVLYRIDDRSRTIFIYRIKHRKEAYR